MIDQAQSLRSLFEYDLRSLINSPKIISIVSGKGGTGKTFFAVNFANQLSEKGYKVLLVDMDFNLSNVHIMLNKDPEYGIFDFISNHTNFVSLINKFNSKLDIIYGDSGRMNFTGINQDQTNSILRKIGSIESNYDFIILDNSAGISDNLFSILQSSGNIFIVSNPEPTAVIDAYVVFKMMKKYNISAKSSIIVNKARTKADGINAYENLKKASTKFLKISPELLGIISYSELVSSSIYEQNPITLSNSEAKPSRQIKLVTNKFTKKHQLANITQLKQD